MSASLPIALILGAGANVGASVAAAFGAKGYRVVTVSRTASPSANDEPQRLHIQADLADPESVSAVFETVRKQLGNPSVVVYNGSCAAANLANPDDPLQISLQDVLRDMNVNTFSALVAAKEAVASFAALPEENQAPRTFIFTGNAMNNLPIPALMSAGMGKSATAHMIMTAAHVYAGRGYRFYYADERKADRTPVYHAIDGEAHGEFYVALSEKEQGPWLATFVKGTGYVAFER
ncbi:putative short-chain dehydrogenase [Clohesyomyces aquaticus]|uniref:Putative short-chain dehydrogenase n=1 Tax=Clohesyomyces aquaticus TaxID=1231657 RepID=A0A1Y1Y709_9PLEO|nr:putative short-chain dehydrogenase [Clohesyomyces aquaticus]